MATSKNKKTSSTASARKTTAKKAVTPEDKTAVPAEEPCVKATAPVEEPAAELVAESIAQPAAEEEKTDVNIEVIDETPAQPVKEEDGVKVIEKKKILFVASECAPFIATGGLAEVIGSLSKALAADERYDVRVIIPLYSDIKDNYRRNFQFIGNLFIPLAWRNQYCGVFYYEENNVKFYFVDNEYYFRRPGCYGYYDDGERFAFFSRSVMEIIPFINFYPEIMHCHDWQAALAAIYLKTIYCYRPEYQYIRAVFTIHNIEYQGKYSLDILEDLFGIPGNFRYMVEYDKCINLMKGAIECCESFSTVSPRYAWEIKDPYYAHGLEGIICRNDFKLRGILNGIDPDYYNPATDKSLFVNYDVSTVEENKVKNKLGLQEMLGLPKREDVPIISMVSRLVSHKGLDLVRAVIEEVLNTSDVQFVVLGTGDSAYESYFAELQRRYIGKVVSCITFNADLSRKIYAGSDIFLMPSKSEPCGLSQMIASRYGTVPLVRETGGLYDSIKPYGAGGNGFTFRDYNAYDMLYVIREALGVYSNKDEWNKLVKKAMNTDFTWSKSAKEYMALYDDVLNK